MYINLNKKEDINKRFRLENFTIKFEAGYSWKERKDDHYIGSISLKNKNGVQFTFPLNDNMNEKIVELLSGEIAKHTDSLTNDLLLAIKDDVSGII